MIASNASAAATPIKTSKEKKYEALGDRVDFRAVGLQTIGAFGSGARSLFDDIAFRIRAPGDFAVVRVLLYRQIAAAIQLENAACIFVSLF